MSSNRPQETDFPYGSVSPPAPPPQISNLNPLSNSGTFVRIEAVHLLIHNSQNPAQIYRKLLAPAPKHRKFREVNETDEQFIKTIRLGGDHSFQFEFDFRVVKNNISNSEGTANTETSSNTPTPEINLLFHEILQEDRKTCNFYLENMGRFSVTPPNHSYRYTTTLSGGYPSRFGLKNQIIRLEIVDLDRTAWFIGEWRVKFHQGSSISDSWLRESNNSPVSSNSSRSSINMNSSESNSETFDEDEIFIPRQQSPKSSSILKIPSTFPSRTSSPLSSPSESTTSLSIESNSKSTNNSFTESFEDLDLSDFTGIKSSFDDSLPNETSSSFPARLLFSNDDLLPAIVSRSTTPKPQQQQQQQVSNTGDLSTVDILHQVGTNLFSTKLGQFMTSSIKIDPNEQNLKTSYSTSTIHLLGQRYQLQGLNSNVLLMESEEADEDLIDLTRISRFNNFSFLLKRLKSPNTSRFMILREVLLTKRLGAIISTRLKQWFESFSSHWAIQEFTPATLKVVSNGIVIEVKVYSLKPDQSTSSQSSELFLVELLLTQSLHSSVANAFYGIAEANAFFVELTAFIVQMEVLEARKPPEIVLMETINAHTEPEQLSQSESIPIVKFSAIPESNSPFSILVYFWSDHLQGWLLQSLGIQGMILSIHPLLDAKMAIQINLSGSHIKASQDKDGRVGNFSLITSRGQVYYFRTVYGGDLKEIIGKIRFALLLRGTTQSTQNTALPSNSRSRRQGSLLQADKIYRGTQNSAASSSTIPEEELERIRNQNMSVMDSFLEDFRTRFWFTYRRNFPRIEPSLFTTDLGWGCMLRTGQCLMAEALARFYFGRKWRLWQIEEECEESTAPEKLEKISIMKQFHTKIVNQFIDQIKGEYSVHRLAIEGAKIGTPIGQWFGPSIIGKVLK